jgi:hypothetical protein
LPEELTLAEKTVLDLFDKGSNTTDIAGKMRYTEAEADQILHRALGKRRLNKMEGNR